MGVSFVGARLIPAVPTVPRAVARERYSDFVRRWVAQNQARAVDVLGLQRLRAGHHPGVGAAEVRAAAVEVLDADKEVRDLAVAVRCDLVVGVSEVAVTARARQRRLREGRQV